MKKLCLGAALVLAWAAVAAAEPPRGSITIDRIAAIKYPTDPAWSPDGRMVAFLWDAAGRQELFAVTPGQAPVALTDFAVDRELLQSDIGAFAWVSPDEIIFGHDGRLWSVSPSARKPAVYDGLGDAANFVLSPDRTRIAFLRKGQVWIASLENRSQRPLTSLPPGLSASGPVFSRDGRWLAFTAARSALEAEELPWNGDRVRSFEPVTVERQLGVVSTSGGEPMWVPAMGGVSNLQWSADDALIYQELSPDGKGRAIRAVAPGATPRTLWADHDDRWWSPTRRDSKLEVSPDGRALAFVSDRTGWIQVYVIPTTATSESEARQLTSGSRLSGLGGWSPDSRRLVYHHSAPGNQFERFVAVVDVATGRSEPIVTAPGVSLDPAFSPSGDRIVYQHSDAENSLDLYVASAAPGGTPVRLSDSMPEGLDRKDLSPPVAVQYRSRLDGQPVHATLMVSHALDRARRHPALVWIHGSGSDQNFLGWHPGSYRMYYSLCQYLAQQGYVILTPDYRGSSGYSRDWSTGVYMKIGVGDTADVASGAEYLKTLPYVDPERIGVFGLSYGGFLTLQALNTDPTLWRAGVDVAGVVDWATYGAGYTTPRLGTPMENPEIYRVSAPILHMEQLQRPLLILHGTNDRNVAFRDSLRVIDVLEKLGKPFEMAIYPGEIHFFRREHVLRDAWRRIEDFFDRTVRRADVAPTQ
jgi:dipeptidyl aminopeptidase/acylaminoacyl peptidase